MICLRCGYCCKNSFVIIVDNPELGITQENLKCHNGQGQHCQHLEGSKVGEYSCAVHNYKWYKKTPCFSHGQIETSKDTECRMGRHILNKQKGEEDES